MYDFGQKDCFVCGENIGKAGLGWIIDGDNAPYDSLCFCLEHEPFFLDEIKIDWISRIKSKLGLIKPCS